MNPETLTWISGVLLLLLFAVVGWWMRRSTPHDRRGTGHVDNDTGCCGPPQSGGHQKH
jgi:hypothetical protein